MHSESTFQSFIAPMLFMVFLISIAIWLVLHAGFGKKVNRDGSSCDIGGDFDGGD